MALTYQKSMQTMLRAKKKPWQNVGSNSCIRLFCWNTHFCAELWWALQSKSHLPFGTRAILPCKEFVQDNSHVLSYSKMVTLRSSSSNLMLVSQSFSFPKETTELVSITVPTSCSFTVFEESDFHSHFTGLNRTNCWILHDCVQQLEPSLFTLRGKVSECWFFPLCFLFYHWLKPRPICETFKMHWFGETEFLVHRSLA